MLKEYAALLSYKPGSSYLMDGIPVPSEPNGPVVGQTPNTLIPAEEWLAKNPKLDKIVFLPRL